MTQLERPDLHAAIETRYPDNTTEDITPLRLRQGLHELVDSVFVTATDTGAVPSVPLYVAGTTYAKGYTVRFTPGSGLEAFYYSLQAGQLPAPVAVADTNWKVVPGPVLPTALGQAITLALARNINGDTVVLGRDYAIELPQASASGHQQVLVLAGIAEGWFASEGYLVSNNVRTPVFGVNLHAQPVATWQVKHYAGVHYLTTAQLTALIGQFTPGQQYVVTDAEPPQLGGDTVPVVVFAQDKDKLAPFGFLDGSTSGNNDKLVEVYESLDRSKFVFNLVAIASPADLDAVRTTLPLTAAHPADYTLQPGDIGALVPATGSSPVLFTVPAGLGQAAPAGGAVGAARVCYPLQLGTGQLSLVAAAGVNLLVPFGSGLKTAGQHARLILVWLDTNTVLVEGGVL